MPRQLGRQADVAGRFIDSGQVTMPQSMRMQVHSKEIAEALQSPADSSSHEGAPTVLADQWPGRAIADPVADDGDKVSRNGNKPLFVALPTIYKDMLMFKVHFANL